VTGVVIKREAADLDRWLASEAGFISAFCRYDGDPVQLEPYQVAFVENRARFRWVTKSRQVGFSWLLALEALVRCHLREGYTSVFVSYNLSDATEKIAMARQFYEELPLSLQKRLVTDSKTELAFESRGAGKRVSRIISVPSKAPRGKKGDIALDELAHYVGDRETYTGSTALILRSSGQLTGCSTPLGQRGVFWEIATEELRRYPHHVRQVVPWWLCRFFCNDVRTASAEAPTMSTEERVERFGRTPIQEQFDSLPLEDFQQELEARFVDEAYSFYPYDLILPNTLEDLVTHDDFADIPKPDGRLIAGFDVGRKHDRSELAVFEDRGGRFICRMLRTYIQTPFAGQEADLRRLLNTLPIARLSIDQSGIGMNLAENLSRDFPQVVPETFTGPAKERWATDFKILLQRRNLDLPRNRDLVGQIHSIKKRVLPSGNVTFDAERNEQGHADRFWAMALACQTERGGGRRPVEVNVRVVG
jgi:phage FluMu gp28-like protein